MIENFDSWWAFCQDPSRDGHADDTAPDGAGLTRWGFTWPTFVSARRWLGFKSATRAQFVQLDQEGAEQLARGWFWKRLCGDQMLAGVDVSLVDWAFTSGQAVHEVQNRLGFYPSDGVVGEKTLGRMAWMGAARFVEQCVGWRQGYYRDLGLAEEFPGLLARAEEVGRLGSELLGPGAATPRDNVPQATSGVAKPPLET